MKRTPVLIISGFLGSGKTTLVRRLLDDAQSGGERLAVISNEFGALGIDVAQLGEGEAFVELEGGCVCCQLSNELVDTLQTLHERVAPDRIVIETSGVALPGDTQLHLGRLPVARWVGEDLIVVVVNAEQVFEGRDLAGTFEEQLTSADVILLNKIDLVPEDRLDEIEAWLRSVEPDAPIVRTVQSNVDSRLLFPPEPGGPPRRKDASSREHVHERFESEEIAYPPGTAPEEIMRSLRNSRALRAKGFVETSEGPRLVQAVGSRIELKPISRIPALRLAGRVVIIRRA